MTKRRKVTGETEASGEPARFYVLRIAGSAQRNLKRLSRETRDRVEGRIRGLANAPRPPGCIALVGEPPGTYRVRVGKVRILYRVDDAARTVEVYGVRPRGEAYR